MSTFNTALITGASMGIGKDIARQLASEVGHLVLVARSEQALNELAEELAGAGGLRTTVIAMDLARPEAGAELHEKTRDLGVDLLVNNAGFGLKGAFLELPLDQQQAMLQLNMATLTDLCHRFGTDMAERGRGQILNVASVAGFQAGPSMAVYCATKAYVLSLSEALDVEMAARGVRVTALCPGAVDTNFHKVAGTQSRLILDTAMAPEPVARAAVRGLKRRKRIVVPGWMNVASVFSVRLLPRRAVNGIARKMIEG